MKTTTIINHNNNRNQEDNQKDQTKDQIGTTQSEEETILQKELSKPKVESKINLDASIYKAITK